MIVFSEGQRVLKEKHERHARPRCEEEAMRFQSGWVLALAALLALAGAGCRGNEGGEGESHSGRSVRSVDFYDCGKSADCLIERQNDCCPCNAGGKQVALNKKWVASFQAARVLRCAGDLLCPQVYLCDEGARAVCRAGRCEIVPGPGEMRKGPATP